MERKTINFSELKAERDGTITPLALAENILKYVQDHDVQHMAVVVAHRDGLINTAQTTMNYLELIGLHATAQAIAIEEMDEPI